jgi:hypothetical protein
MTPRRKNLPRTRIAELFAIADGLRDASDSERHEAVAELLSEFRCQFKEAGREIDNYEKAREAAVKKAKGDPAGITALLNALARRSPIDPLLVQGMKNWAFRIFSQQNPVVALKELLGTQRRRGKRPKNADRDFWIAVAVAEKKKSGMNLEDAMYVVAEGFGLEGDSVRKIYNRNHREAKAHVAMVAMEKSPPPGKLRA